MTTTSTRLTRLSQSTPSSSSPRNCQLLTSQLSLRQLKSRLSLTTPSGTSSESSKAWKPTLMLTMAAMQQLESQQRTMSILQSTGTIGRPTTTIGAQSTLARRIRSTALNRRGTPAHTMLSQTKKRSTSQTSTSQPPSPTPWPPPSISALSGATKSHWSTGAVPAPCLRTPIFP